MTATQHIFVNSLIVSYEFGGRQRAQHRRTSEKLKKLQSFALHLVVFNSTGSPITLRYAQHSRSHSAIILPFATFYSIFIADDFAAAVLGRRMCAITHQSLQYWPARFELCSVAVDGVWLWGKTVHCLSIWFASNWIVTRWRLLLLPHEITLRCVSLFFFRVRTKWAAAEQRLRCTQRTTEKTSCLEIDVSDSHRLYK